MHQDWNKIEYIPVSPNLYQTGSSVSHQRQSGTYSLQQQHMEPTNIKPEISNDL